MEDKDAKGRMQREYETPDEVMDYEYVREHQEVERRSIAKINRVSGNNFL